jgi:hypothetical protein
MASATSQCVQDRRSSRRYPINTALEYRFVLKRKTVTGTGETVNLSGDGVLFQTANPLPSGVLIELSIAWPARLDNLIGLKLYVIGKTVRTDGSFTAVMFRSHEFRTRKNATRNSQAGVIDPPIERQNQYGRPNDRPRVATSFRASKGDCQ